MLVVLENENYRRRKNKNKKVGFSRFSTHGASSFFACSEGSLVWSTEPPRHGVVMALLLLLLFCCPVFSACPVLQTLAGKIQEYIKAVAQLARLYYVERCHKTFVVNAPAWFGLTFRVVSPFLSARTRQKIRILGGSDLDLAVLQDEIDPQVGGSLVWNLRNNLVFWFVLIGSTAVPRPAVGLGLARSRFAGLGPAGARRSCLIG